MATTAACAASLGPQVLARTAWVGGWVEALSNTAPLVLSDSVSVAPLLCRDTRSSRASMPVWSAAKSSVMGFAPATAYWCMSGCRLSCICVSAAGSACCTAAKPAVLGASNRLSAVAPDAADTSRCVKGVMLAVPPWLEKEYSQCRPLPSLHCALSSKGGLSAPSSALKWPSVVSTNICWPFASLRKIRPPMPLPTAAMPTTRVLADAVLPLLAPPPPPPQPHSIQLTNKTARYRTLWPSDFIWYVFNRQNDQKLKSSPAMPLSGG